MTPVSSVGPAAGGTSVEWVPAYRSPRAPPPRRSGPVSTRQATSRRPDRWIIRSVTLATTAFALVDLYLLVSSHH